MWVQLPCDGFLQQMQLMDLMDRQADKYYQTSNIIHTIVGNIIVYHSDVVGASPVSAAPITTSFST